MSQTGKGIFDLYAQEYDNWFEKHRHAFLTEVLALKKEIPYGKKGIDIGVGSGRFAQMLDIRYGVDVSYQLTKIAKNRGCEVAVADALNLPMRANEFDYALLMVTLCFVKNPTKVINEAKRILAKRGKLIIGIIDRNSNLGTSYRKKNSVFYKSAQFYTTEEVLRLLRRNGFHNLKTQQTIFKNPEMMHMIDTIKKGYGKGGFVVISGMK